MATGHDKLVQQVVQALMQVGTVYADLPGHRSFALPRAAELVLAAFVPTRAVFASFPAMSASDLNWRVPDVVVERAGRRVVIDVCGWRESNARASRKIENAIAASPEAMIVGAVLVHEPPARKGFTNSEDRDQELDAAMVSLERTLAVLLQRDALANDSPSGVLRQIWQAIDPNIVGTVRWEAIRELGASSEAWGTELAEVAGELLGESSPLLSRP